MLFSLFFAFVFAVSFLSCGVSGTVENGSEPSYNFKTRAYIEASRNETFSLCPDNGKEGTWISEHSVALDEKNCVSVQAPDLAGSFDILFMENSGRTDTIQVLVDQSYIQMGDYSHVIFVIDTNIKEGENETFITFPGNYESMSYSQTLIVDKTKFTMGDAQISYIAEKINEGNLELYEGEKLEGSKLPLIDHNGFAWLFANERSKREGLDTAYYKDSSGNVKLDSSTYGYRLPFPDEWSILMRAGASTRFFWGDDITKTEEYTRYIWFPSASDYKLIPVAQLLPNAFGLYDMGGIAKESCDAQYYNYRISEEYFFMCEVIVYGRTNESFRLIRKTPKLHKLEKF